MTWLDYATLWLAVYAAMLSTLIITNTPLVAIWEWLRLRGERQRLRAERDCLKSEIKAGDPVYWDGSRPGIVTNAPPGSNQTGPRPIVEPFGVALDAAPPIDWLRSIAKPVDPEVEQAAREWCAANHVACETLSPQSGYIAGYAAARVELQHQSGANHEAQSISQGPISHRDSGRHSG